MAEALAEAIPLASAVIVPGIRHLIPLEAPAALAGLIESHFDS
jgi:pimeloyl-ACP methyl ester carboxylesterase